MKSKTKQVEKELIKTLTEFRPNKRRIKRKINLFPLLGAAIGLIFSLVYVFFLWPKNLSKTIPFLTIPLSQRRLGISPPIIQIAVAAITMGVIFGKLLELLVRRLKDKS